MNYELIESYAKRAENHDIMDALVLLTKAYIDQCGISLGNRTVIYCAAEQWLERLAWLDLPLSEMARKEALVTVMPHITSDYNPEIYDKYDITGMSEEELLSACDMIVRDKEFDEVTNEVLCWGLLKTVEEERRLEVEIETVASDGTLLKGILTQQNIGCTSVWMESPYDDVILSKNELLRDAREMMSQGYDDYQRLRGMETEVKALYPKYQEELANAESRREKWIAFKKVYGGLIGKTAIIAPEKLFRKWFGLEFFDIVKNQCY